MEVSTSVAEDAALFGLGEAVSSTGWSWGPKHKPKINSIN